MRIVLATGNAAKLRELQALLAGRDIELVTQAERGISSAVETGLTFVENAILKARHACAGSGLPAIADDSGLEVDALGGEPGVFSARYSGPGATAASNNELLLRRLHHELNRHARFVCVLALAQGGQLLLTARGTVEGEILDGPTGNGGFGYDPLFFYPPLNQSFAELAPEAKFTVSHRGNALSRFFTELRGRV